MNMNIERTLNSFRKLVISKRPFTCQFFRKYSTEDVNKPSSYKIETQFGFEKIDSTKKQQKGWKLTGANVDEVFENVAEKYDVMNDAMSFGIHRLWKDIFMQRLYPTPGTTLLDVAGGTGDIAFRFLKFLENEESARSHVTVCDINPAMLEVGRQRATKLPYCLDKMDWCEANAEKLPFEDDTFGAYTIAFGIRNVTHIEKVLDEAFRVLRPGGRFMCLEFSHVENETLQWIYDQYSFQVIPVMGELIAGQWTPYQYLVESICNFPNQKDFVQLIREAGFRQVTYENLSLGVVAIHSAFKL